MSETTSDGFMESPDGGLEEEAVTHEVEAPSISPAIDGGAEAESSKPAAEVDPFAGSAEDLAADDTRRNVELFGWADSVLGLNGADLELALDEAVKHFEKTRASLKRVLRARRAERFKAEAKAARSREKPDEGADEDVIYYSRDFKVSNAGVFAKKIDDDGSIEWERICTTRIDIEALTRDTRAENWGTYIAIRNRDGGEKKLAVPHALLAADKNAEVAAMLASLGVGIVPNPRARRLLVQFLTVAVPKRITAVSQIGWHCSNGTWQFVLPDDTIVPAEFNGPRPVLQTASLHVQHGIDVRGTVEQWIERIAAPIAGNSNVHLCVGTMLAGPLLKFAHEPPGFFHIWGTSKIAKSLAGAIGQSVWGRPKVPGEADAFGASWTATAVGLERYAVLRSDVGAYLDEIGEGAPKAIRPAVYGLANGSTKLRGTQDITLRPMESFRILGISTGEPTMEGYLSSGGEKVPAGLKVRLVDVPAEVQPDSAFETCPREQIEELGRQFYPLTKEVYGAVGRAWLQHLVDLGEEKIVVLVRQHRDEWLKLPAIAAVRANASVQVHSILNRFALVATALRMAIEANLLPWSIDDTDLGIAACMTRCLRSRNGRLDLTGEMLGAIEQIRAILAADLHGRLIHLRINGDGKLDYASPADATKRDTLGYVKDGRILVDPTAWRNVLCAGYDPEKTARHLKSEGLLVADDGKLRRQEKVKRGGDVVKARFYVLDPKILDDAAGTGPREASS
jgi:putative DNA primase/helicase